MTLRLMAWRWAISPWEGWRSPAAITIRTGSITAFLFCTWMVVNERLLRVLAADSVRLLPGYHHRNTRTDYESARAQRDQLSRGHAYDVFVQLVGGALRFGAARPGS